MKISHLNYQRLTFSMYKKLILMRLQKDETIKLTSTQAREHQENQRNGQIYTRLRIGMKSN